MFRVRLFPKLRRSARDERGQTVVEFALVLPLLCLLLFGIIQFGITFFKYVDLTSAARDGARSASVQRDNPNGVQAAETAVSHSTNLDPDVSVTPGQPWKTGDEVRVKVTYPTKVEIMGITFWSGPITAESVARIE